MKAVKPDSLLPFAIAAILGFLVLGLKGDEREEPLKVPEPSELVDSQPIEERKVAEEPPDPRLQPFKALIIRSAGPSRDPSEPQTMLE